MRNLKKFLALVLAMMMAFSLMVTVNAATYDDYSDVNSIDSRYAEAVEVLSNIGIFRGTSTGTATFSPTQTITRAEMATIIYRVMTGDVENKNVDLYKDYQTLKFEDVPDSYWGTPYINYAANAGIVVGDLRSDGTRYFYPNMKINGYQVLAILLRALGYDQPGEFEGKNWDMHTAQIAAQLHITDNLAYTLSAQTPRQVVAQMTYNTAVRTSRVQWTPAFNYIATGESLIDIDDGTRTYDVWGAPSTEYKYVFTYPIVPVNDSYSVADKAYAEFYDVLTECEVADMMIANGYTGFTASNNSIILDTYVNGANSKNIAFGNYLAANPNNLTTSGTVNRLVINDLDTKDTVGAPGRWTRVYADRVVYVDTFFAIAGRPNGTANDIAGHPTGSVTVPLSIYTNSTNNAIATDFADAIADGYVTVAGDYELGDLFYIRLVTDKNNKFTYDAAETTASTLVNPMSRTVSINGTTYNRVQVARDPGETTVTVQAMLTNLNESGIAGFKATSGSSYYYNHTFGWQDVEVEDSVNGANKLVDDTTGRLARPSIDSSYIVYTDDHGYVIAVTPVATAYGVGVVLDVNVSEKINGKYHLVWTILLEDGTTVDITGKDEPATFAAAETAAAGLNTINSNGETALGTGRKNLVWYEADSGYYTIHRWDSFKTITETIEAGEADALVNTAVASGLPFATNNYLVDDDTVFFVANYPYKNATEGYVFNNYSIYEGFKDIQDLSFSNAVNAKVDGYNRTGMTVQVIKTGNHADYVLVLYANHQATPKTYKDLPNYVYIPDVTKAAELGDDYGIYNVVINGQNTTLRLTTAAINEIKTKGNGLYTYEIDNVNGYASVVYVGATSGAYPTTPNYAMPTGWDIDASVLTVPGTTKAAATSSGTNWTTSYAYNADGVMDGYLTVADSVQVYVVNAITGKSVQSDLRTLVSYYFGYEISYQFDSNGYINLIYVLDEGRLGPDPSAQPKMTVETQFQTQYYNLLGYMPVVSADGKTITFTWSAKELNAKLASGDYDDIANAMKHNTPSYLFVGVHFEGAKTGATGWSVTIDGTNSGTLEVCSTGGDAYFNITGPVSNNTFSSLVPGVRTSTVVISDGAGHSYTYYVVKNVLP